MKTQMTVMAMLALSTSIALGDAHTEKKGAPAPKPDAAKKAPEPKKEAPAMTMPKPDDQIAALGKMITGTWKCTGKAMGMDGQMADNKSTIVNKVANDLDKWWLQTNFTTKMGKDTYKFVAYTTYNPLEKKWMRFSVDNMGAAEWTTSAGAKDGKVVWEGEAIGQMQMGPSHKAKVRHTEDMTDPKNVKMKGEMTMDGKTWMTGYDVACKK